MSMLGASFKKSSGAWHDVTIDMIIESPDLRPSGAPLGVN